MNTKKYILGIDPGLVNTGWAIIECEGSSLRFIASGTIITSAKDETATRLKKIGKELKKVTESHTIDEAGIEETFVNKNSLSSLKLGQARGAIILTIANGDIPIGEYSATHIKKAIVGVGRASKDQIDMMVKILLPKATPKNDHEADAIAIAITHANNSSYSNYLKNAG